MIDVPTQQPSCSPPATDTVAEVMRPALTTVEPDAHLAAAAYLMKHAGASALVILDDDHGDRPIGLITETDIVNAVADGHDVNDVRIRDLMTSDLTFCTTTTSIRTAAQSMLAGQIRHLPVLHHGELVGMVDIGDLARPSLQLDGPSRRP
ncbi:MAG TPA: CBS domain-containing protein [Jatrophihabitantaceae bacterium]|jgi:CBS domain-containing protein